MAQRGGPEAVEAAIVSWAPWILAGWTLALAWRLRQRLIGPRV